MTNPTNKPSADDELLNGKDHEHQYSAFQCEAGCECNYIHLQCLDDECSFYSMAEGWNDCNVDHEFNGKKRELEARIHELQGIISWNVDAKTNLKVVSTITAMERIAELKLELEKL